MIIFLEHCMNRNRVDLCKRFTVSWWSYQKAFTADVITNEYSGNAWYYSCHRVQSPFPKTFHFPGCHEERAYAGGGIHARSNQRRHWRKP